MTLKNFLEEPLVWDSKTMLNNPFVLYSPRPFNWGFRICPSKLCLSMVHPMSFQVDEDDIGSTEDKPNFWRQIWNPRLKGWALKWATHNHTVHHTHSFCRQNGTPEKPRCSRSICLLSEQGHRIVFETSWSEDCCVFEENKATQISLILNHDLNKLPYNYSTKLVRFPSIAICVDNLWYINVSESGEIVVDTEAYNETQFFREVKLSYINETE